MASIAIGFAGAVVFSAAILSFVRYEQPSSLVSSTDDTGLHHLLRHDGFLFLPALFRLSLWRPLTALRVCTLGLILGAAVFVPVTLMEWKSSGPDSGPPSENFLVFFARWAADLLTAIYPVAGLLTAALPVAGDVASQSFRLITLLRRYGLPNAYDSRCVDFWLSSGVSLSLRHPHIAVMAYRQAPLPRQLPKTKAELRQILAEAVRNTKLGADHEPERRSKAKKIAAAASAK